MGVEKILIISPVRNEAAHIERVVRAVAAQELLPARWIIVDDHSDDRTLEVLRRLESEVPFLTVIEAGAQQRSQRDRLAGGAAPRTFNAGLATVDWRDYTHLMKLDGDIELAPTYLRELMARFDAEPKLGLAGGVLMEATPGGGNRLIRIAPNHVHGALKCYSRECFERIDGLQERLGWDTIDETYARMYGFTTRTFRDLICPPPTDRQRRRDAPRACTSRGMCVHRTAHGPLGHVTFFQSRAPAPGCGLRTCVPVWIRASCRPTC